MYASIRTDFCSLVRGWSFCAFPGLCAGAAEGLGLGVAGSLDLGAEGEEVGVGGGVGGGVGEGFGKDEDGEEVEGFGKGEDGEEGEGVAADICGGVVGEPANIETVWLWPWGRQKTTGDAAIGKVRGCVLNSEFKL